MEKLGKAKKMKILITGAGGLLGHACQEILSEHSMIYPLSSRDLDVRDPHAVEEVLDSLRPDALIHCAAYTRVDDCESHRLEAYEVNVVGTRNIAVSSERHRCLLVHISTDYVFDGRRPVPLPYTEEDSTHPLSWYGHTKLMCEREVKVRTRRHIIVRTGWLYGIHGRCFPKAILKRAISSPEALIRVVNDQFGTPTWTRTLVLQLEELITHNRHGIYHATAEGVASWFEFAREFLELMGIPHQIVPCSSEEFPTPALRPKNSVLENKRLKEEGINVMRDWREDLSAFVRQHREELLKEARGMSP